MKTHVPTLALALLSHAQVNGPKATLELVKASVAFGLEIDGDPFRFLNTKHLVDFAKAQQARFKGGAWGFFATVAGELDHYRRNLHIIHEAERKMAKAMSEGSNRQFEGILRQVKERAPLPSEA